MFLQVAEIKKALTTVRGHLHAMRNHQYLFSASMLKVSDPNTSTSPTIFLLEKRCSKPRRGVFFWNGKIVRRACKMSISWVILVGSYPINRSMTVCM
jgi:hypothetical protein